MLLNHSSILHTNICSSEIMFVMNARRRHSKSAWIIQNEMFGIYISYQFDLTRHPPSPSHYSSWAGYVCICGVHDACDAPHNRIHTCLWALWLWRTIRNRRHGDRDVGRLRPMRYHHSYRFDWPEFRMPGERAAAFVYALLFAFAS